MAKVRRHSSATLGTSWPDGIGWQRQPLRRSAKKRGRADRIAMQCSAVQEPSLSMLAQKQRIENAQWIVAERDSAGLLALSGSGLAEADLGTMAKRTRQGARNADPLAEGAKAIMARKFARSPPSSDLPP